MAKFKHKNGGICEVVTNEAIEKLKKDKNYTLIAEKESKPKPDPKPESSSENKPISDK